MQSHHCEIMGSRWFVCHPVGSALSLQHSSIVVLLPGMPLVETEGYGLKQSFLFCAVSTRCCRDDDPSTRVRQQTPLFGKIRRRKTQTACGYDVSPPKVPDVAV
mmetsp:Transcript_1197/g.3081  ORF Transcript_1197/g.3081 Transcript_1197/m.3081 type:complete len:104 (+) Transcript_1197:283-594(+)